MTVSETAGPEASIAVTADGLPWPKRAFAALAVMSGLVLVVLDAAMVSVALPTIHTALDVPAATTVWVVTTYQLVLVMGLLPSAALGESLGNRRVFLAGIVLFTGASVLCALAASIEWLIAGRVLQGLGAGPVMALSMSLLRFTFPQRMLGRVMGWIAMLVALSTALGPTIGAAILSVASWHWLFAVNIPIGTIVLFLGKALPCPAGNGRSPDFLAMALNASGFALLVLGTDQIAKRPGTGFVILAMSLVSFAILVCREWSHPEPVIPLDLLRRRGFRLSIIASVCAFSAQMASFISLPFLFQNIFGLSAFLTGLCLTPWPLMVAISGPLSGRLSDQIDWAILCAVGGTVLALGLCLAAVVSARDDPVLLVLCTMIAGLGFGIFQVPNNRNMLISVPLVRSGAAGGMQSTARLLGQTA